MNIIEFHKKNNYYVSVDPLYEMYGCVTTFPENIFNNREKLVKTYILCNRTYQIEYYVNWGKLVKSENIQAHSNNIRLLVAQDILLTTLRLKISKYLIIPKEKTIFEILLIPQTEEQKKTEAKLCKEFSRILAGEVSSSNVEGYDQLLSYFERGGFLP